MRLLHVKTLQLTDFSAGEPPKYVILSHCWRHGSNEILYEDVEYSKPRTWQSKKEKAAEKVLKACEVAGKLDYEYIWIDTCCIDKRSSSELSEAINSMFQWYRDAGICLAFLDDVRELDDLDSSRWFTRGWTLQELIAPDNVFFYNMDWSFIGDRFSMAEKLSAISRVSPIVLRHGHNPRLADWNSHNRRGYSYGFSSGCHCGIPNGSGDRLRQVLGSISIATIMSWAAHRQTSREEDAAYCLMGLFDINMPLLYGEKSRAFRRLQEEIIRQSSDQSILAWAAGLTKANDLPSSPAAFRPLDIKKQWFPRDIAFGSPSKPQMSIVKEGLIVDLFLSQFQLAHTTDSTYLGILDCTIGDHPLARPAIILTKQPGSDDTFERIDTNSLVIITPDNNPSSSVSSTPMVAISQVFTWDGSDEPMQSNPEYIGITGMSTATVKRITLAREKLFDMAYWQRQYTLPPIQLRKIVDCDAGEYNVDYAQPDFRKMYNVAPPCNEEYGLISLEKQGSHRFFVTWGVETPDRRMWCKILADDQILADTFAIEKGMGRWGLPGEQRSRHNRDLLRLRREATGDQTDREVLDFGRFSREVLAEMRLHHFLDKPFVELAISVNLPPARNSSNRILMVEGGAGRKTAMGFLT